MAILAILNGFLFGTEEPSPGEYVALAAVIVTFVIHLLERKHEPFSPPLDHGSNARFGFGFAHPKTWARKDPMNSDGNTFIDPKNPQVRYLVYGAWSVLEMGEAENEDKLDENLLLTFLKNFEAELSQNKCRLLLKLESGTRLLKRDNVRGEPVLRFLLKYVCKGLTHFHTIAVYKKIQFHTLCIAPTAVFPLYEDLFLNLVAEFVIFEDAGAK